MDSRKWICSSLAITLIISLASLACAQQGPAAVKQDDKAVQAAPEAASVPAPVAVVPAANEPTTKQEAMLPKDVTIYGEVDGVSVSLDSLTVTYYNYDSDEEKTIEIMATKDTKIENVAALKDIKKGDWVDVTYVNAGGKNISKTIVVEKEEVLPPAQDQQQTKDEAATLASGQ